MKRRRAAKQAENEAYAHEHTVWSSLSSIPMKLADGLMFGPRLIQQLFDPDLDPNSAIYDTTNKVQDYRNVGAEEMEELAQSYGFTTGLGTMLYNGLMTVGDTAATLPFSYGNKAVRAIGSLWDASSEANADMLAKRQAGQTGWQAGGSSLLSFIANTATPEKWRYDDALKTIVPLVADAVIGGENNLIMQQYQALREQGYGDIEAWLVLAGNKAVETVINKKLTDISTGIKKSGKKARKEELQSMSAYDRLMMIDPNDKTYGDTLKSVKRFQNDVGYYNDLTEAIQYAIANRRPQKEIEALRKGQKTLLNRLRKRINEDENLEKALDYQMKQLEKGW